MSDLEELETYIRERDRVLEDGDMAAFRKLMVVAMEGSPIGPPPDDMLETIFHKARYESTGVSRDKRLQSGDWLRATGHHRVTGTPVLPPDQLPE